MSIINKSPIYIPAKVKVAIDGCHVMVERSLGKNEVSFDDSVIITNVGDKICILHKNENDKHSCRMNGTARSMINAMISGVIGGYSKIFKINGVGFTTLMKGQNILNLSLGYSHEILYTIPNGIKLEIDPSKTKIAVKRVDKKLLGQVASDIKRFYLGEPYKNKGVKIIVKFV